MPLFASPQKRGYSPCSQDGKQLLKVELNLLSEVEDYAVEILRMGMVLL